MRYHLRMTVVMWVLVSVGVVMAAALAGIMLTSITAEVLIPFARFVTRALVRLYR